MEQTISINQSYDFVSEFKEKALFFIGLGILAVLGSLGESTSVVTSMKTTLAMMAAESQP